MDARIDAFLADVLLLEGENPNVVREGVRRRLAECEKQFRDAEPDKRMKDKAATVCRSLCHQRIDEEIRRRKTTATANHLGIVLNVIDRPARLTMKE